MECLKKTHPEPIAWTPEREATFNKLRCSLTSHPVLHNLDFTQPFDLASDASGKGTGAILSQDIEVHHHPVVFINRKLTSAE